MMSPHWNNSQFTVASPADQQVQRSVSETHTTRSPPKVGAFSLFLRRNKNAGDRFGDAPPPIPPKDPDQLSGDNLRPEDISIPPKPIITNDKDLLGPLRPNSVSQFAVISQSLSSDEVVIEPARSSLSSRIVPQRYTLPFQSREPTIVIDPAKKALRRIEAQRKREEDEREALREEAVRQACLRRQKLEILRQEEEERVYRQTILQEEVRQAKAERVKKGRQAREAEERRLLELMEKKRAEKEKRREQSKRSGEWRKKQMRLAQELDEQKEQAKRQADEERRTRIKSVEANLNINSNSNAEALVTGWVTIQTNESLVWKRRFFKLVGTTMFFYRSAKDTTVVLDRVQFRGRVRGLKEWHEGFEELEAIPHSFAIEFQDGQGSWSVFSDSEEEKEKLLALIHQAARV